MSAEASDRDLPPLHDFLTPLLRQARRWVVMLTVLGLFAGCASLRHQGHGVTDRDARAELTNVPFFPQQAYQCGPAALATVFTYAGIPRQPQDLLDEVYLPSRRGALQAELLAATRRAGLVPYRLSPDLNALFRELAAGNPAVVLQNQGFGLWPQWHYAVVVGYNLENDEMILRSGTAKRLVVSIGTFDRTWQGGGRWAFVALPPNRLAATATEERAVEAAVALEAVSPAAAQAAYQTILLRWPQDRVARMGLGNIAYRNGHFAEAQAHFRRVSQDYPEAGDAWNNLAQALAQEGRLSEALEAAERAVNSGGARQGLYRSTLKQIRDKLTASPR